MCTVSFVRANEAIIITSNRDEHKGRENAAAPQLYRYNNRNIVFPKDAKAGGTWFAAADNGTIAVLLNGAFIKHVPSPPYRKSRGLILLSIIEASEPVLFFKDIDLQQIEPFTIVLYHNDALHELRWDGSEKFEKLLDDTGSYIWSSATLYTDEVIAGRENKFTVFIGTANPVTPRSIYDFHFGDNVDHENGFVINRPSGMKTFSITQAVLKGNQLTFIHHDLLKQECHTEILHLDHAETKI